MSDVVVLLSDEGLGGVVPFGHAIAASGAIPLLITGPVGPERLDSWRPLYREIAVLSDPYDPDRICAQVDTMGCHGRVAGLFSCYDGLVLPAARAAMKLGLPHPTIAGLERSRNKYATRLATARRALPTPRFGLIASEDDCAAAAATVGCPAVIKPLNGMASHLVHRVDSSDTLRTAYRELRSRVRQNFSGNYSRPLSCGDSVGSRLVLSPLSTFLLEEFLVGAEYSAEVIVRAGRVECVALFHKFIVDPDGFRECGFTTPISDCRPDRSEALWDHIKACLGVLEVDNAAAHVEIMDTAAGPYLVEVNAGRAGGQILVRAVRAFTGIDLITEILTLQCNWPRPPRLTPTLTGRVTTLTVFPPTSGVLQRLDGLDKAAMLPGVVEIVPFCHPGDVLDVRDKEFFAVNLLVAGVELEDLIPLYNQACRLVRFDIVPLAAKPHSGAFQ